jgi:MFS transporter, DHA2 family, multidrug resistance protein
MTPLSAIAVAGIEREHAGSAAALFNMIRNLGGGDRHRRDSDVSD